MNHHHRSGLLAIVRASIRRWHDVFAGRRALNAFRRRASEAAKHSEPIAIVQSCDAAYRPLLEVTGPVNRQYADRCSYVYCDFLGNASPVPRTANFNRYFLLRELMSLDTFRWALWMDADAMVIDHTRRLESLIQESEDKMLIICSGRRRFARSINNGVFFLNLRHPLTASMLRYVIGVCKMIPQRRSCRFVTDQRHMYSWIMEQRSRLGAVPFVKTYTGAEANHFNYDGSFIRHVLRSEGTRAERIDKLIRLGQQVQV